MRSRDVLGAPQRGCSGLGRAAHGQNSPVSCSPLFPAAGRHQVPQTTADRVLHSSLLRIHYLPNFAQGINSGPLPMGVDYSRREGRFRVLRAKPRSKSLSCSLAQAGQILNFLSTAPFLCLREISPEEKSEKVTGLGSLPFASRSLFGVVGVLGRRLGPRTEGNMAGQSAKSSQYFGIGLLTPLEVQSSGIPHRARHKWGERQDER